MHRGRQARRVPRVRLAASPSTACSGTAGRRWRSWRSRCSWRGRSPCSPRWPAAARWTPPSKALHGLVRAEGRGHDDVRAVRARLGACRTAERIADLAALAVFVLDHRARADRPARAPSGWRARAERRSRRCGMMPGPWTPGTSPRSTFEPHQPAGAALRRRDPRDRDQPAGRRGAPGAPGARARLAGRGRGEIEVEQGGRDGHRRPRLPGALRAERAARGAGEERRPPDPAALALAGRGPPEQRG